MSAMSSNLPTHLRTKKKLRILCADDSSLLGDVLVKFFATAGHEVEHVLDGLAAWEKISKDICYFDVLVTDHHMPGLTGLELVELLRQSSFCGRIIVHGASVADGDAEKYRSLGVTHVIAKAAEARELLEIVEAFHDT